MQMDGWIAGSASRYGCIWHAACHMHPDRRGVDPGLLGLQTIGLAAAHWAVQLMTCDLLISTNRMHVHYCPSAWFQKTVCDGVLLLQLWPHGGDNSLTRAGALLVLLLMPMKAILSCSQPLSGKRCLALGLSLVSLHQYSQCWDTALLLLTLR